MKKFCVVIVSVFFAVCGVCLCFGDVAYADEGDFVYISGQPIGISAQTRGLIIADLCEVETASGKMSPLFGIAEKGDVILKVNGEEIKSIYKLKTAVENSSGQLSLTVEKKSGQIVERKITPATDLYSNRLRLGVIAREDVGGIGTLTFVTKDKVFASLGHKISDGESGVQNLNSGNIYPTTINGVKIGESGKAGGLVAELNRLQTPVGEIKKNTVIGVYGAYADDLPTNKVRVANKGEAKMGKAQILTTINGEDPQFYDVEIVKAISQDRSEEKGLVIVVKDDELIEKTGGIVQGMSGSPIIQNGAIIGAVTHVFLNDASRGYGVHARFMYDECKRLVA